MRHVDIWGKNNLDRGYSKDKGIEQVRASPVSKSSRKLVWLEQSEQGR